MGDSIKVEILRPDGIVYQNDAVAAVTLPGEKGLFTVLPQHASLISSLVEGSIKIVEHVGEGEGGSEGTERVVPVKGGFVEVNKNVVSVCVK